MLTNRNLENVQGEIKEIARTCNGTPTAKLIAILEAAGITATKEIAELLNLKPRAIQCARKSAIQCASATECAQQNAPAQPSAHKAQQNAPDSATECAASRAPIRACLETPSGLLTSEVKDTNTPIPPKIPKGPTPTDALKAFEAYNATALRCGIPQAAKFTPDRKRKIIARLRDYGLEGWERALANIEKSAFLTGGTDHGFRADLDFMLQAKSFGKLHDGSYGNGRHAGPVAAVALAPHLQALIDEARSGGVLS